MPDYYAYLSRIGFHGPLVPSAQTLCALQRAHLLSVPFENLDVILGRPIQLEEAALFDKIVNHRRGGFCYELNGLFARLLEWSGFEVSLLNARSVNDEGSPPGAEYGPEFDHMALLVRCLDDGGAPWLVDVGWGNGPLEPVRLVEGIEQAVGEGSTGSLYRIITENGYLVLTEQGETGKWLKHYAFTRQPHVLADFAACCRYHQTSPESMFTRKRLCTLFLPDGRVTLSDLRLILTRKGEREERSLPDEAAFQDALKTYFQMEV